MYCLAVCEIRFNCILSGGIHTSVAVSVSSHVVKPSPIGINDDGLSDRCAASGSTGTDSERWVNFSGIGTNLLSANDSQKTRHGDE